jgi:hypothetical protein
MHVKEVFWRSERLSSFIYLILHDNRIERHTHSFIRSLLQYNLCVCVCVCIVRVRFYAKGQPGAHNGMSTLVWSEQSHNLSTWKGKIRLYYPIGNDIELSYILFYFILFYFIIFYFLLFYFLKFSYFSSFPFFGFGSSSPDCPVAFGLIPSFYKTQQIMNGGIGRKESSTKRAPTRKKSCILTYFTYNVYLFTMSMALWDDNHLRCKLHPQTLLILTQNV